MASDTNELARPTVQQWEWRDTAPTVEEVMAALGSLPTRFGIIRADEFAEFVLPMMNRVKEYDANNREIKVPIWKLYMQVAGRQMMLDRCVQEYGWTVVERVKYISQEPWIEQMRIEIRGIWWDIDSPLIEREATQAVVNGTRFGTAKAAGGTNPIEKMETAARGRALAAWGFGVLPGSGVASLEEMQIAAEAPESRSKRSSEPVTLLPRPELELALRTALEEYRLIRGRSPGEAVKWFQGQVLETFQVTIEYAINDDDDSASLDLAAMQGPQIHLMLTKIQQAIAKLKGVEAL